VILRLVRPDLLGDLDLLTLVVRLRFREACESAPDEENLRRRSLTGLRELLGDLRRRRGGVRDRDLDSLGAGECDLSFALGVTDRDMSLGNLLLSLLGDHDLSLLRLILGDLESADGERRARRGGGDLERSDEGDLRARRRGGLRECDEVGEKRNDCLMQSVDAHEICHGGLLGLGLDLYRHLGRICLVRDVAVGIVVSCFQSVSQYAWK
jgi:hypothetical protein